MKRTRLGLTGAELAQRADISPFYLSRIEKGAKVADEDVAARLARALQDDQDLYRAWARASSVVESPRRSEPLSPSPEPEILRVPVLAEGADPGKLAPSPLAIQDRLLVDRHLVADHPPERLFAYEVTRATMTHLRGLASPGDHIVFQRGGRVSPDRICAVRTPDGIVLARVLFKGRSLLLLPGEGERDVASVEVEGLKALPGVIAGTHVLLIRH